MITRTRVSARRRFLCGVTAAANLWPFGAGAETAKIARVGLLGYAADWAPFDREMRALGYVEGKTIMFERRPVATGAAAATAELLARDPDAIVAGSAPLGLAAKRATARIPIVVVRMADPIELGLVASLAKPGGNITGFTTQSAELSPKRLDFVKEMVPKVRHVVLLGRGGNQAFTLSVERSREAARALGVSIFVIRVTPGQPVSTSFPEIAAQRPDALLVLQGFVDVRTELAAFALERRIPAMFLEREFAEAGGLVSYGPSYADLFRRSAIYLDKILKGAKPADLPVEQPTKFELVLNLKSAKTMGFTFPEALLARADEVIE
jgi:putative tryptophan/tyrosine transport system substrate-binding protein